MCRPMCAARPVRDAPGLLLGKLPVSSAECRRTGGRSGGRSGRGPRRAGARRGAYGRVVVLGDPLRGLDGRRGTVAAAGAAGAVGRRPGVRPVRAHRAPGPGVAGDDARCGACGLLRGLPDPQRVDPGPGRRTAPGPGVGHGGSFTGGSGSDGFYRGGLLARERRRGHRDRELSARASWGFLAHPELAEPGQTWLDGEPWTGWANWGLADQVAALAWVRDNVAESAVTRGT